MYDFCFTFPYAALLGLGGLMGFVTKGSTGSLAGGVGSAVLLSLFATISLRYYHQGKLCKAATFFSLLIAVGLTWVMYKRYSVSGKIMPAGLVFFLSGGMSLFYLWNLFLGPQPPTKSSP